MSQKPHFLFFLMEILRPWQKEVAGELFSGSHNIVWAVDPVGGAGKTWLADYLVKTYKAQKFWRATQTEIRGFKVTDPGVIVFDIDYNGYVDQLSLLKMGDASAFTADCVGCRPKVLFLATTKPPECLGEMVNVVTIKN